MGTIAAITTSNKSGGKKELNKKDLLLHWILGKMDELHSYNQNMEENYLRPLVICANIVTHLDTVNILKTWIHFCRWSLLSSRWLSLATVELSAHVFHFLPGGRFCKVSSADRSCWHSFPAGSPGIPEMGSGYALRPVV